MYKLIIDAMGDVYKRQTKRSVDCNEFCTRRSRTD